MLRLLNQYCSNCLRTQRFLDLGSHLVCECCSKRLERVRPATETLLVASELSSTPRFAQVPSSVTAARASTARASSG